MSGICLPIDADSTTGLPQFPAAQHRAALGALMAGRTDRPLGALSGVTGADPTFTVGTTDVTFGPFRFIVDPETALTVGAYLGAFLDNETVGFNAADQSFARIDRYDVQVPDDPAGASPLDAEIVYTAGTPSSSPVTPAAPARSFPLGRLDVPAAGTGSPSFGTATMARTCAAGGILQVIAGARPSAPYVGQVVYDSTADALFRWNGTAWKEGAESDTDWQTVPLVSTCDANGLVNLQPAYRVLGSSRLWMRGYAHYKSGNFPGGTTTTIVPAGSIPAEYCPAFPIDVQASGNAGGVSVRMTVGTDGSVSVQPANSPSPAYVSLAGVQYPIG